MNIFESSFESSEAKFNHLPLAVRLRPQNLKEFVGQEHLLYENSPLRRLIEPIKPQKNQGASLNVPGSLILWGSAGCGKTTLAYLISKNNNRKFVELSAVSSGVKEVREVIEYAKKNLVEENVETVLFIDEIHRFSKAQQDALLPSVENRTVILVAATTENPYFSIINPLLSRSLMLTLKPLEKGDLLKILSFALSSKRGLANSVRLEKGVKEQIIRLSLGDVRKMLTILEAASASAKTIGTNKKPSITLEVLEKSIDIAAVNYDKGGDEHYDVASAFIKSMRGSDVDAALHYLARMIVAGEDPRFIARRIMIAASEEIGMADPSALQIAVAAANAVEKIGMPESQLILAQAVIHICVAPKSNSVTNAIFAALDDVKKGKGGKVPVHLRDAHYSGAEKIGHGVSYLYAHDYPHDIVSQQYLPDDLYTENNGKPKQYYFPKTHGKEASISTILKKIRGILRGGHPH